MLLPFQQQPQSASHSDTFQAGRGSAARSNAHTSDADAHANEGIGKEEGDKKDGKGEIQATVIRHAVRHRERFASALCLQRLGTVLL